MRVIAILALLTMPAMAHDSGQWDNVDSGPKEWYSSLMQPDVPSASCCGTADAYWCDDVHVRDGHSFCSITDDRPDEPRQRPHRELGETFEIPPNKMLRKPNPTGHRVIFLSRAGYVYCFADSGGI